MDTKIRKVLEGKNENYIFPFFWQHGEDEETLRRYMGAIDACNIKGVCIESRPHPDFCGEKWWHDMDIILNEARQRNMKVWILDDSHFPTGYANGAMKEQPDALCRQSICCRTYDLEGEKCLHIAEEQLYHPDAFQKNMVEQFVLPKEQRTFDDDRLLSVYAVRQDEEKNGFRDSKYRIDLQSLIQDGALEWKIPEGRWKVYVLHLSRNHGYHRDYINMMDRASCRVLIDAVYKPHYEHYKEDFGKTIAGFFSDEPELGNGHIYEIENGFGSDTDFPWSQELEKRLEKQLGVDYAFWLVGLWDDCGAPEMGANIRYTYMNAVTELVQEDFSNQLGTWCRQHGVQYIGHLIEDDNHHTRTGSSLGHYFRGLAGQDMAGIDDIGGQVFPQGEDIHYNDGLFHHRNGEFYHYMLGKLGSSAAAIEPLKQGNSLCEIFGNYGWSEGVRLEKYLADHFLVRGINHFVPHAFSAKKYPDPDCPPHFYAQGYNPQYRHFGCLMTYINRMCELLSGGRHIAPVAILYHAEAEWAGQYMTSDQIGHVLADSQIEFDYIPQDVFINRPYFHTEITAGVLQVNTQRYHTVIVPYAQYMTKALAAAVTEMKKEGISVLLIDAYPEGICDLSCNSVDAEHATMERLQKLCPTLPLDELVEKLQKQKIIELHLSPQNDRIRYLHYVHDNGLSVWMFVNEGDQLYQGDICFDKGFTENRTGILYEYDAWKNQILPAEIDGVNLHLLIEPLKSKVIIFDPFMAEQEARAIFQNEMVFSEDREELSFLHPWKRSICRSIDYPAFTQPKEVAIPDQLAEEEPKFSGYARYENRFELEKPTEVFLEITDAAEGVEVFVNGVSLGIQIVPVFRYDLSACVRAGVNEIAIEVATTLERENAGIPDATGQIVKAESKSGITGNIRLWR